MSDKSEMDAMMADGLLDTVRTASVSLFGVSHVYPCDDVKRMADEITRLRADLANAECRADGYKAALKDAEADLAAARELLKEARDTLYADDAYGRVIEARIAAALKGDGDE